MTTLAFWSYRYPVLFHLYQLMTAEWRLIKLNYTWKYVPKYDVLIRFFDKLCLPAVGIIKQHCASLVVANTRPQSREVSLCLKVLEHWARRCVEVWQLPKYKRKWGQLLPFYQSISQIYFDTYNLKDQNKSDYNQFCSESLKVTVW